jgi:hypothetical protein
VMVTRRLRGRRGVKTGFEHVSFALVRLLCSSMRA